MNSPGCGRVQVLGDPDGSNQKYTAPCKMDKRETGYGVGFQKSLLRPSSLAIRGIAISSLPSPSGKYGPDLPQNLSLDETDAPAAHTIGFTSASSIILRFKHDLRPRPNETNQCRVHVSLLLLCYIFRSVTATAISQLPERNPRALRSESVQLGLYPPHRRYSNARRSEAAYGHLDSQRRTTRAHSDDAHTLRRGGADQPCR